jgi:hypothetical protein
MAKNRYPAAVSGIRDGGTFPECVSPLPFFNVAA